MQRRGGIGQLGHGRGVLRPVQVPRQRGFGLRVSSEAGLPRPIPRVAAEFIASFLCSAWLSVSPPVPLSGRQRTS